MYSGTKRVPASKLGSATKGIFTSRDAIKCVTDASLYPTTIGRLSSIASSVAVPEAKTTRFAARMASCESSTSLKGIPSTKP